MSGPDPAFLPHGSSFRLVQTVDQVADDGISCTCRIPERFPLGSGKEMPAYLALEGLAQAAGLLVAHLSGSGAGAAAAGGPVHGFVARIRAATFHHQELDGTEPWVAHAALDGRSGHMILCQGEVRQAGVALLQAGLALYI